MALENEAPIKEALGQNACCVSLAAECGNRRRLRLTPRGPLLFSALPWSQACQCILWLGETRAVPWRWIGLRQTQRPKARRQSGSQIADNRRGRRNRTGRQGMHCQLSLISSPTPLWRRLTEFIPQVWALTSKTEATTTL